MRKNFLLWSLTAATMMFFASCENENGPVDAEPAKVAISIVSTKASTPQAGSTAENKISNLEAYTFSSTGAQIDYVPVPGGVTTATLNAQIGSVTIAVVANSSIGSVSTLSDLEAKLSTFTFSSANCTLVPSSGFVMSATKAVSLGEGTNHEAISVERTVSKFNAPTFNPVTGNSLLDLTNVDWKDIKTIFPTFTETSDKSEITFEEERYVLVNGLNKSILLNDADYNIGSSWPTNRGTWIPTTLTYINSTFDASGNYTSVYSSDFIDTDAPTNVFVHENFPYADHTVNGVTGYNPKEVYCFIVEGTLSWNGTDVTRYWRVNLVRRTTGSPNNDNYRIFRNGWYQVNIDLVKSIGHGNPKDAEEEVPVIPIDGDAAVTITVTPAPWDVYVSETQM